MPFPGKRTLNIAIAIGALVVPTALLLGQPRAITALRLARGYSPLDADARVYYETGAEYLAEAIADALPAAVTRVEGRQLAPFEVAFRVYVCASHESFTRRIGGPVTSPVRGIAFPRDIWVSPRAFSFHGKDTHRETVAHELSHVHLGQKMSWLRRVRGVPSWFQEGLADWVADTGHEQVSRHEARAAVAAGSCIVPEGSGRLRLAPKPPPSGLPWPMFHAQSRMFVEYLRSRGANEFDGFLVAVLRGAEFEAAFGESFHISLLEAWSDFQESMQPVPR